MLSLFLILLGLAILGYGIFVKFIKADDICYEDEAAVKEAPEKEKDKTNDIDAQKCKYGPVTIYYASQSGTSEGFAETLRAEGLEQSVYCKVVSVEKFNLETNYQNDQVAIFMISTHYEGEAPDTAVNWWEWMTESHEQGVKLEHLKYTVFGLGDRTYKHFCKMGIETDRLLEEMGAKRIYKLGTGTNDKSLIEEDFEEWKIGVWAGLLGNLPNNPLYDENNTSIETSTSKFNVKLLDEGKESEYTELKPEQFDLNTGNFLKAGWASITKARELRQKATETDSTLEFEIKLPQGMDYITAYNLNYFPENSVDSVKKALECVGLEDGQLLEITSTSLNKSGKLPAPPIVTAGNLFRRFVDLQGVLKKSSIKALAKHISDPTIKEELESLLKKEGDAKLKELNSKMFGLIDLLTNYNIKLTPPQFLDVSSRIVPRLFTIASSSDANPRKLTLVASMSYKKVGENKFKGGLASISFQKLFEDFKNGKHSRMRVSIQASTFHRPEIALTPCIFIAAGTGYAPFRGFAEEREFHMKNNTDSKFGKCILIFGCRKRNEDYIYKDEIMDLNSTGVYTATFEAFSREDPDHKVYVQNILEHKKDMLNKVMFEQNGSLYLCGNISMSNDVKAVIVKHIQEIKEIDEDGAKREYELLVKDKRICIEAWSA